MHDGAGKPNSVGGVRFGCALVSFSIGCFLSTFIEGNTDQL